MSHSPQRTEHQAGPPCLEALVQGGHRKARPAPFFPDLGGHSNDQHSGQEGREEERPLMDERRQRRYSKVDTGDRQLDQG